MEAENTNYVCRNCNRTFYTSMGVCVECQAEGSISPIRKNEKYKCFLNGKLYGVGDLAYMNELFADYVVNCKMYGKTECEFRIVRV